MDLRVTRFLRGIVLCSLTATFPALSRQPQQPPPNPQTRPATGRPQQPGGPPANRPNPGGPPSGQRPQPAPPPPSRPNQPRPQPGPSRPPARPPQNRPVQGPGRPPQWGRPPASRPNYTWRPSDRDWLRRRYRNRLGYINRARRPVFRPGGYFPYADMRYLSPLPPDVSRFLPPPPPGYRMGYWSGYVLVYDPTTYFIANVIDLL